MRISSVELKTRLGHYLRTVERSGEPVEVCVRNRPVAFLTPYGAGDPASTKLENDEPFRSVLALRQSGMTVEPASNRGEPPIAQPVAAGDGRTDINTMEKMRATRDW